MKELTNAQKSIWVTEQYYKGTSINNICGTAIIEEKVDFEKLEKSIEIVCQKHDNFKLQLIMKEGEAKQVLSEEKPIKIDTVVVAGQKELEIEREKIVKKPFKLEKSQLYKFYIFKFENGHGAFMLNIHHLIADAWTLAFICNEIIKTYSALKQNQEIEKQAIYSYIDYIKSEEEYQKSEKYQKDKKYWEEKFTTIPEVATIPGSKSNSDETNPEGERKQFNIDVVEVEKIKQYCKQNKISLYNFFMAIYAIYISEISNLDEFVIGTPILNRTNFKEKNAAGMFINMAPLKINISQDMDFKTFIKSIAIDSMQMLKHQKYSYQCLLENLREKNKTLPNLYKTLLSYQITNAQMSGGNVAYKTEWTFNGCCAEDMDIQIYDLNDTGSLNISYDYKTNIYEQKDIENLHKRILYIIQQVISKEDIKIKDIEIVTPEEKKQLVIEFNKTELEYNQNIPIIKYFEEQVEKTPNNVAIVFENKKMTYKELNEKANSLAYKLRENGVTNNTIVGIMEERSFEMMIAIIAVLKSGGCYIPIAPDYPKERIEYMLEDSNASILIAEASSRIKTDKTTISIKHKNYDNHTENLKKISKPEDISYLIYTSGSTGTPKGVMLKQKNLTNFYNAMLKNIEYLTAKEPIKIISITTVSFDIFIFETLISLTRGLTLYMTNEDEQKITEQLEKKVKENQIQAIQTTPSVMKFHLENLADKENLKSLKYIMLAGEPLPKTLVDKLKETIPGVTIYNGYGPSETTIFSTTRNVTDLEKVTIGKPISNTQIYILNKNQKLLPQGTIGELYISGDGVGKGYMNKKEQTESSFVKNPFIQDHIMYKVGDLGAFDEKGEITCYGRVDNQIKIRGLRVELPEIEKQMISIYNISNAVVVKKEINGRDALCAYYTQNGPVEETVIKAVLQNKLPQYMVPQYFVRLEEMPYTPNGKIDKKALPKPNLQEKIKEKIEIRNNIDKELLQIIKKMSHLENVELSDTLLELGGDSLTAITLSTKISSKFDVQISIKDIMANKTIKEISDTIRENQQKGLSKIKIEKAPKQDVYPLSSAQKRIYYNSKMIGEENTVYNMPGGILVDEILDKEKVKKIFEKIIERHEILKTKFILQDGEVKQKIEEKINFEILVYKNTEDQIQKIIKEFSKPFNLEKAPLFRVEIHYIDGKKTLLLLDTHHIIMDGTSLNNLIIEFNRLYNGDNLKRIPIQYKDYAVWENVYNESKEIKNSENYWINKFKDSDFSSLNLPYNYKMLADRTYNGNKITKVIDEKQFKKIERYAKKIGVSPYMFFVSTFFILLYKYTGQKDITLGSPMANRDINETKRMIGMFVNNIVLRGKIDEEETFQEFLKGIKEQVLDDLTYQPYPFDMLVKKLGVSTDNLRNPLFDVMFTYQNKEENIVKLDEKETEIIEIDNKISKFNLSLEVKPKTHTINIEYRTDLFKRNTIEKLFEHYMNTIKYVMQENDTKIKDIEILSMEEKNKILNEFNNTKLEYSKSRNVIDCFEEQARKNPNKIAVIFEEQKITYKELSEKANKLANYIKNKDVKENEIVGIMLPRSIEVISSIIGVLKAGACYIPIDPAYPKDRIEYMLRDSNAKLLITNNELYDEIKYDNKICANYDNIEIYAQDIKDIKKNAKPENLAYVIYTSGSTGKPKGVKITHQNLYNFINGMKRIIDLDENKVMLSVTTICFDIFGLEMWGALTSGLTLVMANENEQNTPALLNNLCLKNKVNMIQTTPSRYSLIFEGQENLVFLKNMTDILVGGEPLEERVLKQIKESSNAKIFNMYGPTETTIWSTVKEIINKEEITIGKPIANTQVYVLDENLKVVPIGIAGELYIAGDGVGKGYLNKEEITKERYIKNPFVENSIMYKTGDICKFDENGELYCLGRIDNQVKVRGLRIELEEIEKRILEFPNIKKAKVVKQIIENKEVISAYYISKEKIKITELRTYLDKYLPNYMIPTYLTELKEFPYTPNGKIDKNALNPIVNREERENKIIKPTNEEQQKIYNAFTKILKVKEMSIDDNFFEYGGDSISAMMLQSEMSKENLNITYSDIFKYPTIRRLAEQVKDSTETLQIKKVEEAEYYPTSSAQKRVYLTSSMDKDSTLYNITGGILVDDMLDIAKLQKAVNKVVARHEVLRTYFEVTENGEIIQKIAKRVKVPIIEVKADTNNIDEIFNKYQQPFDLGKAPLLRTYLAKLPNNKILFMLDVHHIIFDGGSLNIFLNEVLDLYKGNEVEKLPINYKDFAVWENKQLENNKFEISREFWKKQFDGEIPILNMPSTYSRPVKRNYKGETYTKTISKELTERIEKMAKANNVTPYMIMLSAYYILLYKYTGQEDIIVGTSVSGRVYHELESLLGMFVNSLPLRQQISSKDKFIQFLNNVKEHSIECFSHQEYPFDVLVNELDLPRDTNRNPLFDTMFIYQNNGAQKVNLDEISGELCIPKSKTSKFDLSLEVVPLEHKIKLSFEYWTELFDNKFINRFAKHYLNVLQSIVEKPEIEIKDILILSENERNKILYEFNDTKLDYPKDRNIAQLFEEQVQKNPNKIAVIFEDKKLTYKQLNEKANQLANYIRGLGVRPNDIVGIMLPRSLELVSTILGVKKSGACYIPIDPTYPSKRIEYMLENSQAKILITNDMLYNNIKFKNKICADYRNNEIYTQNSMNLDNINNMSDLAYVIYTSGSTGKPKGVKITNRNLTNFIFGIKNIIDFNENKTMVSVTTISFDIFELEIWESLTLGLTLVMANENEQNIPSLLNELCINNNVNMIQTTPSRYSLLFEEKDKLQFLSNMTDILVGGEPLEEQVLKQIREKSNAKIFNMYGPTETTIWSTIKEIEKNNKITIGRPIGNTQVYVLDENLQPVPIGSTGELYIAGDGVGQGYLNREEMTKERYLKNPFIYDSIMYKTGDICKFDEKGELHCLGRIDNQVKVRGLRIELEEIEKRILEFPNIKKTKVVKQVIGNREMISAYYIAKNRIRITELRSYLYKYLPNYMVPSYFTALDSFPYTPNGKIDKKALPIPNGILKNEEHKYVAPNSDLEVKLVEIWEKILNTKPIGITDNFFELGGDSILAMHLNVKLLKITDKITYADIFTYPTISELAGKIEKEIKKNEKAEDLSYLNIQYKNILEKNMEEPKEVSYHDVGNVLLTGATGFLGIHILEKFLNNEKGKIYVLIRKEPGMDVKEKLLNKMHYYFGDIYDEYIDDRIIVVEGEISEDGFGLKQEELFEIGNSINAIINSAAKVSHYGKYSEFYNVNVKSVEKIINFAETFNLKIFHISTLSVSGNSFADQYFEETKIDKEIQFYENNLYIGQSLENVYVRSKFEAEKKILDAILKGTDAYILRMGNLMPRLSDGKFQDNISENAYMNRIKEIFEIGCIPDYLKDVYLELTPIDSSAEAVLKIMQYTNKNNRIYHIFNDYHVYISKVLKVMNELNENLIIIENDKFKQKVKEIINSEKSDRIGALINDLDKDLNLQYDSKIKINSEQSKKLLKMYGFTWTKIGEKYLKNILKLIKGEIDDDSK